MQHQLPLTVYTAESSLANPAKMLADMLRDVYASRGLAWQLALRDIKAQYRQTLLGLMWAFILPLANTVTWIFLSSTGIIRVGSTGSLPYALYVFTGTMLWAIFMDAVNSPLQQVQSSRSLLSKLNFPREAVIVSGLLKTLFNASIKVALTITAVLLMGVIPDWNLALFPIALLSLILTGTAIGLFITPLGALYGDIGRTLTLFMQFLMYLTPVVFPMPKDGWVLGLFNLNPITPLIVTARSWLTGQETPLLGHFIGVNLAAFGLLLIVWAIYRLSMPILIERMGS